MHALNTFAGCSHKIIMLERKRGMCCEVSWPKNALTFYRIRIKYDSSMISFYFRLFFNLSRSWLVRCVFFPFSLATKLKFIGLPFRIGCFLTVSCDDGMTKTTNRKNEREGDRGTNKRRNKIFCDNHLLHLLRFWNDSMLSSTLCLDCVRSFVYRKMYIRTNKPINHVKQKLLLNAIWCKQMKFNDAWCVFIRIQEHISVCVRAHMKNGTKFIIMRYMYMPNWMPNMSAQTQTHSHANTLNK